MKLSIITRQRLAFALSLIFVLFLVVNAQSGWSQLQKLGTGDLVSVYFTSSNTGWIGGDRGYLASTDDGGRTWKKQSLATTEDINEVYFRGDEQGYVLAGNQLFITQDEGESWREIKVNALDTLQKGLTPEFLSIRFVDKRRGYIVGSISNKNEEVVDSLVLQTRDGGETWTRIIVPAKTELFHLDFVGESRGWIVGDKGIIIHTEDGGGSWQTQYSGTDQPLYNVDFRDSKEGYIAGGRGVIMRTENGGRNWERVATNVNNTLLRVIFTDDKNGFVAGRGGLIMRSEDKGKSWIKQESKTTEPLYGLFMEKKYGWAVGGRGLILRYQK
jgi:photosystem II stability/assembly factor-like uncharacterized protein